MKKISHAKKSPYFRSEMHLKYIHAIKNLSFYSNVECIIVQPRLLSVLYYL